MFNMNYDLFYLFSWWFLVFVLGTTFLPLTFFFFKKFFDSGYIFAKILSFLLITWSVWLLGSLKILPFNQNTVLGIVFFWLIVNLIINRLVKPQFQFKKIILANKRIFLIEELLFLLAFLIWAFVRSCQPDIQGLEKFMDYGFINSILKSQFFPPTDMWLAGQTINYYYFGHLVAAVLTKIANFDSSITYNLILATIFGLNIVAGFSIGANLIFFWLKEKKDLAANFKLVLIGGFLTTLLLNIGGNLHPFYWFLGHKFSFAQYWYPDATRFIVEKFGAADNTIHEFPIYSYVVADLHGHLLNLPFVLLFIGFLLKTIKDKILKIADFLILSLILAVMYMSNAWDLPIYLLFTGLVVLYIYWIKNKPGKTFLKSFLTGLAILALSLIFSLPFHLDFKPIASSLSLVDFHTPLWMLLVLWGLPLLNTAFLISIVKNNKRKLKDSEAFLIISLFLAWFLILIPEIFYVKDIYIHSYQRANTMFKLTYQSFVIFSLTSGLLIIKVSRELKKKLKVIYLLMLGFCLFFVFVYPYFTIHSQYSWRNYQGLYGLNYLKDNYLDDYQAILWLKQNVSGQPVIVEAVGESYTDFARVSANTGLPTILGWRVHEWLWRGSFDQPGTKTEEVKTIYESDNLAQTKDLLNRYQVQFIFVGTLEKEQYQELNEEKIIGLGRVVFSSGQTKIYRID